MLGWCIARGWGGGLGCPKWGVAQKLGKTRQNGPYGVFGGPPIPTYTPPHKNRATARLGPFPGIPASPENPVSRSADETPTDYPVPGCPRFNPGPAPIRSDPIQSDPIRCRARGRRSAKTPHAAGLIPASFKQLCRMHRLECTRHISIMPLG